MNVFMRTAYTPPLSSQSWQLLMARQVAQRPYKAGSPKLVVVSTVVPSVGRSDVVDEIYDGEGLQIVDGGCLGSQCNPLEAGGQNSRVVDSMADVDPRKALEVLPRPLHFHQTSLDVSFPVTAGEECGSQ